MSQLHFPRMPRAVLRLPVRPAAAPRSVHQHILDTVSLAVRQASMAPSNAAALDIAGEALKRVAALAHKPASKHARLIAWINSHDRPEPTIDNGDDTLTVSTAVVRADLNVVIQRAVIPATMAAARDLLGY